MPAQSTYKLKVTMTGVEETRRAIQRSDPAVRSYLAIALYGLGLKMMRSSMSLVPVDTGTLRRSAYTAPPTGTRNPIVELGYGTSYAVVVHERHSRQRKFLEIPMRSAQRGWAARVARETRKYMTRDMRVKPIPAGGGIPTRPRVVGGGRKSRAKAK